MGTHCALDIIAFKDTLNDAGYQHTGCELAAIRHPG